MKQTYVIIIIAAVGVLLTAILFLLCVYPLVSQIAQAASQIEYDKARVMFINVQQKSLADFTKHQQEYKANLDEVSQALVDPQNPLGFITFMESSAAQSGVATSITIAPSQTPAKSSTITFQMNAQGSFLQVMNFVNTVETGPYLVTIDSLSITKNQLPPGQTADKQTATGTNASIVLEVVTSH